MDINIKACDRCLREINKRTFPRISIYKIKQRIQYTDSPYGYGEQYDTLCKKCYKDYKKFMDNETVHGR